MLKVMVNGSISPSACHKDPALSTLFIPQNASLCTMDHLVYLSSNIFTNYVRLMPKTKIKNPLGVVRSCKVAVTPGTESDLWRCLDHGGTESVPPWIPVHFSQTFDFKAPAFPIM